MSQPETREEGAQDQCVTKELDALLTELYVLVDDHVIAPRTGRGRAPLLSDSELITLAVAQVLLGYHSERRWVRHLHAEPAWRALFPLPARAVRPAPPAEERPAAAVQGDRGAGPTLPVLV